MKKTLATVSLLGILALAGCTTDTQPTQAPATPPVTTPATPPSATGSVPAGQPTPSPAVPHQAVIYTVDFQRGTDRDNYLVPQTIALTDARDPAREAVRALIGAPNSPLPAGTRLEDIKIQDGMATLDFSRPPVDVGRGDEATAQALGALQRTLGQFPNVSSLQITVHGQPLPAIGEAAGGPMDVIRPGGPVPEADGA